MRLNNKTLTENQAQTLIHSLQAAMLDHQQRHVQKQLNAVNEANLKTLFEGYQSMPKPYGVNGHDIRMWNNSGSITTPGFKGSFNVDRYKEDKDYLLALEFPKNILEIIGEGLLVIELGVDTRKTKGWVEFVQYKKGSRYYYVDQEMNWNDAEAHCNRLGGHLASVMSPDEGREILAVLGPSYDDAYNKRNLWLGGRRKSDGTWIWSDGSKLEMGLGTWNEYIDGSAPFCLDLYYRQWYITDCSKKIQLSLQC